MLKTVLKNIVYSYYPKSIDSIKQRDEYNNSNEFKRLLSIINAFYDVKENKDKIDLLNEEFKSASINNLNDVTSLSFDRCLTFEIDILDGENKLYKLRIVISILIPYFFVYVLENEIRLNPYKWVTLPVRNKEIEFNKFRDEIDLISNIVKKTINYNMFPEKYLNFVIPMISHSDIREGDFTFFNAFFRSEKI